MESRVRYSPTRVSQALLTRLERHGAFQHTRFSQPSYHLKDVPALATYMQVWQPHTPVRHLQILLGPTFIADGIDRAALMVWAAVRMAMEADREPEGPTWVSLAELPPLFVPTGRRVLKTVALGTSDIPVIRGSSAVGQWQSGAPLVVGGVLSMTVTVPQQQAADFEGITAWLVFKRSDGTEIPLARGTVNDGKISFGVDVRLQGVLSERATLKDPTMISRRFAIRLI